MLLFFVLCTQSSGLDLNFDLVACHGLGLDLNPERDFQTFQGGLTGHNFSMTQINLARQFLKNVPDFRNFSLTIPSKSDTKIFDIGDLF